MGVSTDAGPRHDARAATPAPQDRRAGRPAWERGYARVLILVDAVAAALATVVALLAGDRPLDGSATSVADGTAGLAVVLVWVATVALFAGYEAKTVGVGSAEYKRVTAATAVTLGVITSVAFTFEIDASRGYVFGVVPLAGAVAVLGRQVARKRLHRLRAAGRYTRRVLVVGRPDAVAALVHHFRRAAFAGYRVVAACTPGDQTTPALADVDVPVVGTPERAVDVLADQRIDTIAIADSQTFPGAALRHLGWALEGTGVDLLVAPAVTEVAGPRISVRPVAGVPLLHVEEPSLSGSARFAKSVFDRAVAVVVLVVLAPFLAVLAILVKASSPGPVLFRQIRVGREGREFRMWKFRTMVDGADQLHDELRAAVGGDSLLFKLPDDPRLTRIGRFLRRHSLDELPQLWNVLRGDMSVVGPRPPLPSEVDRYPDDAHRRLLVKPGLTGLWQVSGRADLSWADTVRLDLYYVENWSWMLDLLILVRTIPAVVTGRGAY